jgi:multiple sugar transport system permease protein
MSGIPYLLPSLLILIVIIIAPIVMTLYFSLTNYSVLDPGKFIGFQNYVALMSDEAFRTSVWQTVVYTIVVVPTQTVLSLVIAAVIAKRFRHRFGGFARSVLFIPVLSSLVIVGIVWRFLLDSNFGLVNQFLGIFGIPNPNWLGQPHLALLSVALVTVWKNIGYFLVIFYAGIMGINGDLYEAAAIDGASSLKQFLYVTVPSLKPVTFLVVILGTIWSFQVFDLVYTMTGGGPGGATTTIVMSIYQAGFQNYQMGYASAMSVVLLVITIVISMIQRRTMGRER